MKMISHQFCLATLMFSLSCSTVWAATHKEALEQAGKMRTQKNFSGAYNAATEALNTAANDNEKQNAIRVLADVLRLQNKSSEAGDLYVKMVEIFPANQKANVYNDAAVFYMQAKKFDQALNQTAAALKLSDATAVQQWRSQNLTADIQRQLKAYDLAMAAAEQALNLADQKNAGQVSAALGAYFNSAMEAKKFVEAAAMAESKLNLFQDDFNKLQWNSNLARAYYELGNFEKLSEFGAKVMAMPNANMHYFNGIINNQLNLLAKQGKYDELIALAIQNSALTDKLPADMRGNYINRAKDIVLGKNFNGDVAANIEKLENARAQHKLQNDRPGNFYNPIIGYYRWTAKDVDKALAYCEKYAANALLEADKAAAANMAADCYKQKKDAAMELAKRQEALQLYKLAVENAASANDKEINRFHLINISSQIAPIDEKFISEQAMIIMDSNVFPWLKANAADAMINQAKRANDFNKALEYARKKASFRKNANEKAADLLGFAESVARTQPEIAGQAVTDVTTLGALNENNQKRVAKLKEILTKK